MEAAPPTPPLKTPGVPLSYSSPAAEPKHISPPLGPFITAVTGTLFSTAVLIALAAGMQLNLITAFAVLIPGMTFATLAIAISMGWIFISIGRYKTRPRWNAGTAVFITITMLELLVLTYIAGTAP